LPVLFGLPLHGRRSQTLEVIAVGPAQDVARAFVLEHLAEITAIDPAVARRAPDEVFGLVRRRVAETFPMYLPRGITTSAIGSCVIANPLLPSLQRVLSLVLF
jgi:hypothetical protein